ncbi:hypothetical protein CC85DRAFT_201951 [Cutaneotrichosporon oleaginosum]|uniref:Uncharacterized protein n=1 Tax=Cutaneotrichosporon oleaginosum TaxID=879819 RepID=A0A0J0XUE5_9TREE|nr:uncharacterized protein CC85DRAFT_201951 [Cutaneotrichosporon oleaginosum]KLT44690.1 hypothetical protein CC85DRAFT_201951 [Cutaneotrichosporon oleaginosum]TXT07676.1 hypothetical protein COLE_04600 [Cutaneotrichosporon oleaginosum]
MPSLATTDIPSSPLPSACDRRSSRGSGWRWLTAAPDSDPGMRGYGCRHGYVVWVCFVGRGRARATQRAGWKMDAGLDLAGGHGLSGGQALSTRLEWRLKSRSRPCWRAPCRPWRACFYTNVKPQARPRRWRVDALSGARSASGSCEQALGLVGGRR